MCTVRARRAGGASGAARHVDAMNNGRQDIDQIYTSTLTVKFAKVAVFNVWLPVGHLCVNYLRHRQTDATYCGRWVERWCRWSRWSNYSHPWNMATSKLQYVKVQVIATAVGGGIHMPSLMVEA